MVPELRGVPFDRQWVFTYYDHLHKRVVVRHYPAGSTAAGEAGP
ncbi:MAG TPA: hypothetical protein VGH33_26690 [Isosphaeraceae bacterium]